jgi:hypothetical protein
MIHRNNISTGTVQHQTKVFYFVALKIAVRPDHDILTDYDGENLNDLIIKQLLDEAEHDIKNYSDRGQCYLPKRS